MKKSTSTGSRLLGTVGKNIKASREKLGLTQSQLANELGVEVETVSRYERGLVAPSFQQLENMEKALNVPVWQLFSDGTDIPNVRDTTITDLVRELSNQDRDFLLSFVRAYAEHHKRK